MLNCLDTLNLPCKRYGNNLAICLTFEWRFPPHPRPFQLIRVKKVYTYLARDACSEAMHLGQLNSYHRVIK